MVLSLQQAEMFVELPHSDTDGVNFASGVQFFNPCTVQTDRYQFIQHSYCPTITLVHQVLKAIF